MLLSPKQVYAVLVVVNSFLIYQGKRIHPWHFFLANHGADAHFDKMDATKDDTHLLLYFSKTSKDRSYVLVS
jgi:hypothetical protein